MPAATLRNRAGLCGDRRASGRPPHPVARSPARSYRGFAAMADDPNYPPDMRFLIGARGGRSCHPRPGRGRNRGASSGRPASVAHFDFRPIDPAPSKTGWLALRSLRRCARPARPLAPTPCDPAPGPLYELGFGCSAAPWRSRSPRPRPCLLPEAPPCRDARSPRRRRSGTRASRGASSRLHACAQFANALRLCEMTFVRERCAGRGSAVALPTAFTAQEAAARFSELDSATANHADSPVPARQTLGSRPD